jgi:GNAT superfamily N-acetyltransferase
MSEVIRQATQNDIIPMAVMWAELCMEENPESRPDVERWSAMQRELMRLSSYYAFVVEKDGDIVGFNNGLVLTDIQSGFRYVEGGSFFVMPEHRGGQAGAMLHRKSYEVAKELGAKFLRRKVSAANERMVRRFQENKSGKYFLREYIVDEII